MPGLRVRRRGQLRAQPHGGRVSPGLAAVAGLAQGRAGAGLTSAI